MECAEGVEGQLAGVVGSSGIPIRAVVLGIVLLAQGLVYHVYGSAGDDMHEVALSDVNHGADISVLLGGERP